MADDKRGRDKQAHDEERRQRERELQEARARADEAEPVGHELGDLDEALGAHDYPITTDELIEAHGDRQVESRDGWTSIADVLARIDDETYDSAEEVRARIQSLLDRG